MGGPVGGHPWVIFKEVILAFLDEAQHGFLTHRVELTSGTATLVSATSGRAIVVDKIMFSADEAGTMLLNSDTSQISMKLFYGAKGGMAIDDYGLRCTVAEPLKITTTGSGDQSIWLRYYLA